VAEAALESLLARRHSINGTMTGESAAYP